MAILDGFRSIRLDSSSSMACRLDLERSTMCFDTKRSERSAALDVTLSLSDDSIDPQRDRVDIGRVDEKL